MPPPRLKRSNTAGSAPASLEDGEIAINQADGKLYYQTSAGGVASFSALPSVASTMTGVLTVQPAVGPASPDGSLRVIGDNTHANIAIQRHSDTNANPSLRFKRTRGTKAAQTVAQSGDSLGAVAWHGVSAEGAEVVGGSIVLQCTAEPVAGDTSLRTQMNISIGGGTLVTQVAAFTPTTCNFLNTLAVNGSSVIVSSDSRLSDTRIPTDGSVTTAKIADASITTAKIADGAVVTVDIANSAVTYAKIQEVSSTDRLLGRSTAGAGVVEEITCTAFGRSLLSSAGAADVCTTIGALATSGGTVSGGLTCTGVVNANGTIQAIGGRSLFRAVNERYAVGAAYSATSGIVYFGAGNESATPDAMISNAGGVVLMSLLNSGVIGVGVTSPALSSGVGIHSAGSTFRLATSRTPASSTATGNTGEICWDSSYLYVCVATNTWRRLLHSTW